MKKKIFAVLMTTATVAGLLSGCGGNNGNGSDSAAEGKVINIYSWMNFVLDWKAFIQKWKEVLKMVQ